MTSDVDSMSELVQFGLLQFVSAALLLVFTLVLLLLMSGRSRWSASWRCR